MIQAYYRAAILDQLKAWFHPSPEKLWVEIEKAVLGNRDLPSLLLAKATGKLTRVPVLPSIQTFTIHIDLKLLLPHFQYINIYSHC